MNMKRICLCLISFAFILSACANTQQPDLPQDDISNCSTPTEEYTKELKPETIDTPAGIEQGIVESYDVVNQEQDTGFLGDIHAGQLYPLTSENSRGFSGTSVNKGIYINGFFYPVPARGSVYGFSANQTISPTPRTSYGAYIGPNPTYHLNIDGVFIRPTLSGYIVVNSSESMKHIDRDTGSVLHQINIPQNITYPPLNFFMTGAYRVIRDVTDDLSAVLYVYQEVGEYFADWQNAAMNGVFLMEYPDMASRQIMPEGYFYHSVRFVNNDKMVMAYRFGGGGLRLVSYDMESGEFRVVLAIEPGGTSFGNLKILNYWAMHHNGFYDIRQSRMVELSLPELQLNIDGVDITENVPYTISYAGLVYFFNSDNDLVELNPQTGQERLAGYSMGSPTETEIQMMSWLRSDCPNTLIAWFLIRGEYPSGVYRFEIGD